MAKSIAPERQKLVLIQELSKAFNEQIQAKQKTIKLKAMADVAQENQQILNTQHPCFMFEGRWYTYPYNAVVTSNGKHLNRSLDPSLRGKAVEIMHASDVSEAADRNQMKNLINNALGLCRRYECLGKLLPDELFHGVEVSPAAVLLYNYKDFDPITQEEIDLFKEKNRLGYGVIKRLYMIELLLAKVKT